MAEMTAMEFLKEYKRMCEMHDKYCSGCPIRELRMEYKNYTCRNALKDHPEEVIAIVQKWAEEHPVKTMKDDLIEKFPNLPLHGYGVPMICPWVFGYSEERCGCKTKEDCVKCWNRPLEE